MNKPLYRSLKRLVKAAAAAAASAVLAAVLQWLAQAPEGVPVIVLVAGPPLLLALEKYLQGERP